MSVETEPVVEERLGRSTGVVSIMTLLSRILGFIRDVLFAIFIGASAGMDAFLVAFKIPNFMRRLFAEGAFSQSFVPVLTETRKQGSIADVRELTAVVGGTLAGVLLAITVVGVVGAPVLIALFAPGFIDEPEKFGQTVDMVRVTFPYLFFISLTALAAGVLNSYGRFAVPAVTPVILNLCLITAIVFFAPSVMALAVAVFIAGVLQLLFQVPFVSSLGALGRPRWGWHDERVQKIIQLMLPILFGSSVAQLNLLIDTILASLLVTGSVTWLYLSDRLMEFPLGIFSIAIATVILPSLSSRHAGGETHEFSATLDWALRVLMLIGLPAMFGLFLLAGPMVATLFQYQAFTESDVVMTQYSLMAYSLGFIGFSLVKVLVPGYFARQDTRTPVIYGVAALVVAMVLNVSFVVVALQLELPAIHTGLALATSLGACLNAGLLYRGLRSRDVFTPKPGWGIYFLQLGAALVVMTTIVLWMTPPLQSWFTMGIAERVLSLLQVIVVAAAGYFAALLVVGLRPRDLRAKFS